MRPVTIGALTLTVAVSIGLYALSYEVQRLEAQLADLNHSLLNDREDIQVLEAEWSYLNQPERLQVLAAHYLDLEPVEPNQIASAESLPWPMPQSGPADDGTPRPGFKPRVPAIIGGAANSAVLASVRRSQ
jgi:hypothetical protein